MAKGRNQVNKKVVISVLLGVFAVALVVALVFAFVPGLSGNSAASVGGTPALKVNGQVVTAEELQLLQRSNPLLSATTEGTLGDDLKTVVIEGKVQNALRKAASSDQDISRADVNKQVDELRKANNLTDNKAWVDRLAQVGFTDASYREEVRSGLAIEKKQKSITDAVPAPTDAQLKQFYDLNGEQFKSEARVIGRQIVVADKAKAESLLQQARAGGDFAALASANSTAFKERGGALGPLVGGKPSPVAAVALPQEVSAAAFALTKGGITDVVPSGGKFFIVKVEQYVPESVKPFDTVKADVTKKVKDLLAGAALEQWYDGLRASAKIEYLLPAWKTEDPTVAVVDSQKVPYSAVLVGLINNQQFGTLLQQVPPDQAAKLVNQFLKPGLAEQVIEQYASPIIVKEKNLALVGSRASLAQQLVLLGSKDASVTDADIAKYYQQNIATTFTTKGGATVSEAVFASRDAALAFRKTFDGSNFVTAASKAGGTVSERGTLQQGDPKLNPALGKAIFDTASLRSAGAGSVSDVIESGKTFSVAYVTDLVKPSVKTLAEVKEVIRPQLLAQKRLEVGAAYLKAQLKGIKVQNDLPAVLSAQEKRVAASAAALTPSSATPSSATPSAGTPSSATPSSATPSAATP
jgi:parvulin-like peptidyl-prolyl isomerase